MPLHFLLRKEAEGNGATRGSHRQRELKQILLSPANGQTSRRTRQLTTGQQVPLRTTTDTELALRSGVAVREDTVSSYLV